MESILSLRSISKAYPGVKALDDISVNFIKGEIHALLGENGAGKSTLIKIISGAVVPDQGTIAIHNKEFSQMNPILSKQNGIEVIYQEFNLVDSLSCAENIYIGERQGRSFSTKTIVKMATKLFQEYGFNMKAEDIVGTLSPAKKQIVEICKAISRKVKVLIMDEPTAPLSNSEVELMFHIVERLKSEGVTIIYISHRMDEIFRLADRVTVLRDGQYIQTLNTKETNRQELVSLMVGRKLSEEYPRREKDPGEVVLEVEKLCGNGDSDISFQLRKGEILGVAGLVGSGRTELAQMIFGVVKPTHGKIKINHKEARINTPYDALRYGIGLIPEDRKQLGCILEQSVGFNIAMASVKQLGTWFWTSKRKEQELVDKYVKRLKIKITNPNQMVQNLSGGNQQKVVLAKELAADLDILIFDEPTRGIDVGAKQEIYILMNELANQGKSILMISSDMEEMLGMSDRIIVLYDGELSGELKRKEFSQEQVLILASGLSEED